MSGFGLIFKCSLGTRRGRLNYGSKLFFLCKNAMFWKPNKTANIPLLSPSGPKVIQTPPPPPKNGVKWVPKSTFSATCPKCHFLDSTWGITTFPPSWVDPFSPFCRLFSCRKGGCELVPQQIAQNSSFSDQGAKLCKMWLTPPPPGGAH